MPNEIRTYLISGLKPLSLNEAYATMQGRGNFKKAPWKNKVWRRKTSEAYDYQFTIQDAIAGADRVRYGGFSFTYEDKGYRKVRAADSDFVQPLGDRLLGIGLTIVFFIPPRELTTVDKKKFKGRDVSNYLKLVEDAVFEYLGVDDSASLEPFAIKRLSPDDNWHMIIQLDNAVSAVDRSPIHESAQWHHRLSTLSHQCLLLKSVA